jgi:hypothetical protein
MPRNVYILRDVARLTAMLNVACRKRGRRGRLRTARLLREHGPEKSIPDLVHALVGECPQLQSTDIYDRCDAYCPDLAALFAGGRWQGAAAHAPVPPMIEAWILWCWLCAGPVLLANVIRCLTE